MKALRFSTAARALVAAVALGALAAPAPAIDVWITAPGFGTPILGETRVTALVEPAGEAVEVELRLDGRVVARLDKPPFRWLIDVGEENAEHVLEVVARAADGAEARDSLVTPRLRVDDKVGIELQQLYVTATRGGDVADDLSRSEFTIVDDREPQEIVTFERGDVPLTVVFLIDASDSMRGRRLAAALDSTGAFLDGLAALDQAMLLLFSDRVVHSTPFTGFGDVLRVGLDGVEANGGTAVSDHLYVALKLLEERQGRRVVILLTDGLDTSSVLEMSEVAWAAERSQALIYWLRPQLEGASFSSPWRDADGYRRAFATLETVVEKSGGEVVPLGGPDVTAEDFLRILDTLRGQYVLGYYPTTRKDDGSWHPVRVRVARAGVKLRFREGYVDY